MKRIERHKYLDELISLKDNPVFYIIMFALIVLFLFLLTIFL